MDVISKGGVNIHENRLLIIVIVEIIIDCNRRCMKFFI